MVHHRYIVEIHARYQLNGHQAVINLKGQGLLPHFQPRTQSKLQFLGPISDDIDLRLPISSSIHNFLKDIGIGTEVLAEAIFKE